MAEIYIVLNTRNASLMTTSNDFITSDYVMTIFDSHLHGGIGIPERRPAPPIIYYTADLPVTSCRLLTNKSDNIAAPLLSSLRSLSRFAYIIARLCLASLRSILFSGQQLHESVYI